MADKKKRVIPRGVRSDVCQWFVKVEPGQDGKASVKCTEYGKQSAFHGGTSNLYEHLSSIRLFCRELLMLLMAKVEDCRSSKKQGQRSSASRYH